MKRDCAARSLLVLNCLALLFGHRLPAQPIEPTVGDTKEYAFHGFLCEGSDDVVRPGYAIAVLGMFGQTASHTETRFSTNLAKRFAPLVSRVEWLRDSTQPQVFYGGGTFGVDASRRARISAFRDSVVE